MYKRTVAAEFMAPPKKGKPPLPICRIPAEWPISANTPPSGDGWAPDSSLEANQPTIRMRARASPGGGTPDHLAPLPAAHASPLWQTGPTTGRNLSA